MAVRKNPDRIHTFAISIMSVKNCFEMRDPTVMHTLLLHMILEQYQWSTEMAVTEQLPSYKLFVISWK